MVASVVYYVTSVLFPAKETMITEAIFDDLGQPELRYDQDADSTEGKDEKDGTVESIKEAPVA